jgi:hypothetical protein
MTSPVWLNTVWSATPPITGWWPVLGTTLTPAAAVSVLVQTSAPTLGLGNTSPPASIVATGGTPSLTLVIRPAAASVAATGTAPGLYNGAPIAFSAKANGFNGFSTAVSWSHTAVAADYVVVDVVVGGGAPPTAVTYGGTAMTALSSVLSSNSTFGQYRYGIVDGTGGAKTVSVTGTAAGGMVGSSDSYANVGSVGASTTVAFTTGTAASQTVTYGSAGQMIVQSFGGYNTSASGVQFTSPSGGINRYNGSDGGSGALGNRAGLCTSDATATTTFTATGSSLIAGWTAIATILLP